MQKLKRVMLLMGWTLLSGWAGAQSFPSKPVKFIVPFPPGGGAESTARLIAQKLSDRLGQAVVVETKPGAGGNIGTEFVARSPKDGYTMLLATSGMSIQPHLARLGWDPIKDFAPIGLIASYALVIAAHPSVSANNLQDLVSQAKANPSKISYGSSGSGGPLHMGAELFSHQAGIKLLHVPYKGNAPMTLAILGGEINLVFDSLVRVFMTVNSNFYRLIGIEDAWFGVIGSATALLGLLLASSMKWATLRLGGVVNFVGLGALLWLGLWGVAAARPGWWGVLGVVPLFVGMRFLHFFLSHYMNAIVPSEQRATALSFRGLSMNLAYGGMTLLFGWHTAWLAQEMNLSTQDMAVFAQSLQWWPWFFMVMLILTAGGLGWRHLNTPKTEA